MRTSGEFAALMQRVKEGDEDAARELLDTYGDHIRRAVRRRLSRKLRSQFDSEDFTQAAWASFYAHRSRLSRFQSPAELVAFLARVATNKVAQSYRQRGRRQQHRALEETSIDHLSGEELSRIGSAANPTPSEVLMSLEVRHQLTAGSPDEIRCILEMRLAGASYEEISEALEMPEVKVRRILRRMSEELQE